MSSNTDDKSDRLNRGSKPKRVAMGGICPNRSKLVDAIVAKLDGKEVDDGLKAKEPPKVEKRRRRRSAGGRS